MISSESHNVEINIICHIYRVSTLAVCASNFERRQSSNLQQQKRRHKVCYHRSDTLASNTPFFGSLKTPPLHHRAAGQAGTIDAEKGELNGRARVKGIGPSEREVRRNISQHLRCPNKRSI